MLIAPFTMVAGIITRKATRSEGVETDPSVSLPNIFLASLELCNQVVATQWAFTAVCAFHAERDFCNLFQSGVMDDEYD